MGPASEGAVDQAQSQETDRFRPKSNGAKVGEISGTFHRPYVHPVGPEI